eukprot:scaffold262_cov103-Isochrysis_galbana.AAC.11
MADVVSKSCCRPRAVEHAVASTQPEHLRAAHTHASPQHCGTAWSSSHCRPLFAARMVPLHSTHGPPLAARCLFTAWSLFTARSSAHSMLPLYTAAAAARATLPPPLHPVCARPS